MIKRFLLGFLSGFLNLLTPKVKYSFFISTGVSSKNNCEDIINNDGIRICEKKPYSKEACLERAKLFDMNERFKEYIDLYKELSGNQ